MDIDTYCQAGHVSEHVGPEYNHLKQDTHFFNAWNEN